MLGSCREQINALGRVEKKTAQFTYHMNGSDWKTLAHRRTIARLHALLRAYSGEQAWKVIRDRLRRSYYLSEVDHVRKIRDKKQRTDIGKYSFIIKTIKNWKQLNAETLSTFPCKPKIFRIRGSKVIINGVKWNK